MQFIESIFLHGVNHGGDPVKVANEIFETHNFRDLEVAAVSGAETTIPYDHLDENGHEVVKVAIPFFAENPNGGDSLPMLFSVEFCSKGVDIGVYQKN